MNIAKQVPPFILASGSPRRKELLQNAGFDFEVLKIDVDETIPPDTNPVLAADSLALKKLEACKSYCYKSLVLTADTIVSLNDLILGKPESREEASYMLQSLSGHSHQVITSVCLGYQEEVAQFNVTTEVRFARLDDAMISYYIDHYLPYDKAGSYGIQEWIGDIGIPEIKGSFTNVVGLPMHETYRAILHYSKLWISE